MDKPLTVKFEKIEGLWHPSVVVNATADTYTSVEIVVGKQSFKIIVEPDYIDEPAIIFDLP